MSRSLLSFRLLMRQPCSEPFKYGGLKHPRQLKDTTRAYAPAKLRRPTGGCGTLFKTPTMVGPSRAGLSTSHPDRSRKKRPSNEREFSGGTLVNQTDQIAKGSSLVEAPPITRPRRADACYGFPFWFYWLWPAASGGAGKGAHRSKRGRSERRADVDRTRDRRQG